MGAQEESSGGGWQQLSCEFSRSHSQKELCWLWPFLGREGSVPNLSLGCWAAPRAMQGSCSQPGLGHPSLHSLGVSPRTALLPPISSQGTGGCGKEMVGLC